MDVVDYAKPGTPHPTTLTGEPPASPETTRAGRWCGLALLAWVLLLALGWAAFLLGPFPRLYDWNTGIYGSAAHNLVHDGFGALRGGAYVLVGDFPPHDGNDLRDFYPGHPPMIVWLAAGWMMLFGKSIASIHALPIAFSLLNVVLVYALVKRVFNAPTALAAAVIYSLMPMTLYFGKMLNMEPFAMTFLLCAALAYLRLVRTGSPLAAGGLIVAIVLGCWTDWPVYVFAGLLAVFHWLSQEARPRPWKLSAGIVVTLAVMVGVTAVYFHLNGSSLMDLVRHAEIRSGAQAAGDAALKAQPEPTGGFGQLAKKLFTPGELKAWFIDLFTAPALLLALVGGFAWSWWSRKLQRDDVGRKGLFRIMAAFFVMQVLWTVAFAEGAARHDYWNYYFSPVVAILAAGLCAGWTVRPREDAPVHRHLLDRATWAVALSIPLFALPVLRDGLLNQGFDWQRTGYIEPLTSATTPRDAIFTDRKIGYALGFYAERIVFYNREFTSIDGIAKWRGKYALPDHRVLYLWENEAAKANPTLHDDLVKTYGLPYKAGVLTFFVLHGEPNPDWQPFGAPEARFTQPDVRASNRAAPVPGPAGLATSVASEPPATGPTTKASSTTRPSSTMPVE